MSSDAEASGEWVEKRGAATDHVEAVVVPEERTGQFRDPWLLCLGPHGYVTESVSHWVALVVLLLLFLSFFLSPSI